MSVQAIVTGLLSLGIIFGGVVPYIPQYFELKSGGHVKGFSLYTCLVLIVAYILRIAFWFKKRFEYPLLIQSFVMLTAMILLIEVTTSKMYNYKGRYFTDFELEYFWNWTNLTSYLICIAIMVFITALVTYLFFDNEYVMEGIGFLSVGIESMLPFPQIVLNFVHASTEGMSVLMVILWTIGDILKTCYFIYQKVPIQFPIFGVIQVILDHTVLFQVFLYNYYGNSEQ